MRVKTTALTLAIALALLGASGPARADNSFSIRISNSWVADPSFDVVSDNDHLVQAEFNYARKLLSLWHGELWVEAAYMAGPSKAVLFGDAIEARAFLQNVTFSARYAYPVFTWLLPYARLGLGVGVGTLELESRATGSTVLDRAAGVAGHLLVGVEALWPHRALLTGTSYITAGVIIEAGYGFGSRLGFELAPEEDEEIKRIPLAGSDAGSLDVNGWQLRVGGVLRF